MLSSPSRREIVLKAIILKAKQILLLTQEIKTIRILTHLAAEFKLRAQALLADIYSFLPVLEKPPRKKETGKKGKKNKKKKKKKKPKASTGSQTMEE
ncbi:hypothetical protein Tco_1059442 [Tanacetum coccineum]